MKVIRLGISGIKKKLWLNIFLMIEVLIVITALNIMIANMNSKEILYEPFKYMAEKNGAVVGTHDDYDSNLKGFKKFEKKLKGSFTVHRRYERLNMIQMNANRSLEVRAYGYETEFYKNIHIPLSKGSWNLTSEDGEYIECVICPNRFGVGVGSILTDKFSDENEKVVYKVVGVLANPTYAPSSSFAADRCTLFFDEYDMYKAGLDSPDLFMYVNGKKLSQYKETNSSSGEFITYNGPVRRDIELYNRALLEDEGDSYSLKEFRENSMDYIMKMQRRLIPIFGAVMFVMMVGIVSASMIQMMSQMRQFGVFYLCGSSRIKCVMISIVGNLITYIISAILSVGILVAVYNSKLRLSIGMLFRINNVWATLGIMIILVIMSIIVPFIMLGVSSVKSILIENEE